MAKTVRQTVYQTFTSAQVRALLIPLIAEQVLTSLMGCADTLMVSSAGEAAVSAVSLVNALNQLMVMLFSAMSVGGTVVVSQLIGRKDLREAGACAKQLMMAITALAGGIGLLCVFLRGPMLQLIYGRVEADVMAEAKIYLLITALSYPFLALASAGGAIFRAGGNSRLPMMVSLISNVINVAGNAVLILGFHMGAAGVAIPTLISRIINAAWISLALRNRNNLLVIRRWLVKPSFRRIRQILRVGIPSGVENSLFQLGKLMVQTVISGMGTTAIAANSITSIMEGFSSMSTNGIVLGTLTISGTCMGAGEKEEAEHWTWRMTLLAMLTTFISCVVAILLIRPLTSLTGLSPEAADLACKMTFYLHLYKFIPHAFSFVLNSGMRGAGDGRFSMIVSSVTMWLFRVLTTALLARFTNVGPMAMWIGMSVDWTARAIIFTWRFKSRAWMNKRVLEEESPQKAT